MLEAFAGRNAPRRDDDLGFVTKLADKIAEGIGTVQFLVGALVLIFAWVLLNGGIHFFLSAVTAALHGKPFDPAPWILLNLVFSFEAFFTGSLVVMATKAAARRDHAREEAEAKHREELALKQLELLQKVSDKVDRLA